MSGLTISPSSSVLFSAGASYILTVVLFVCSSSGPTNSMRGAAFLASLESGNKPGVKGEAALVVDIGGTTVRVHLLGVRRAS